MKEVKYLFWVGTFKYSGTILSEDDQFFHIKDDKIGEVSLPKGSTVRIKVDINE